MPKKLNKKRPPSNSATGKLMAMQAAMIDEIRPPAHVKLEAAHIPFWNSIIAARALQLWNDSDLETAAQLARTKSDIEKLQNDLIKEGYIIKRGRNKIVNPKHSLVETLIRRSVAMSRVLQVHSESAIGRKRDTVKAKEQEEKARAAIKGAVMDPALLDLIPTQTKH